MWFRVIWKFICQWFPANDVCVLLVRQLETQQERKTLLVWGISLMEKDLAGQYKSTLTASRDLSSACSVEGHSMWLYKRGHTGMDMEWPLMLQALISIVCKEINVMLSVRQISRVQSGPSTSAGLHTGSDWLITPNTELAAAKVLPYLTLLEGLGSHLSLDFSKKKKKNLCRHLSGTVCRCQLSLAACRHAVAGGYWWQSK